MTTAEPIRDTRVQRVVEVLADLEQTHGTLDLSLGIETWMRSSGWRARVDTVRPELHAEAETVVRQLLPAPANWAPARPHLKLIRGEG